MLRLIFIFLFFISCEDKEIKVEPKILNPTPKNVTIIEKKEESIKPPLLKLEKSKPVKIKLKRDAKGNYSWEINGEDIKDIIKSDKALRKALIKEEN